NFDEQIALCASLGVRHYQYRPREIDPRCRDEEFASHGNHRFDLTPRRFEREGGELTRRLRAAGLECWGASPALHAGMSDEAIDLAFTGAAAAEARRVVCAPPPHPTTP